MRSGASVRTRRTFLASLGGAWAGVRWLQAAPSSPVQGSGEGRGALQPPVRKAKTTLLFKSPEGYPNAIAVAPEGLWIAEQKSDNAHLVDWTGKVLHSIRTQSKNTSGIAYGGGFVWMGANAAPQGIFQTDLNSQTISHRQIPLGPEVNGGGCHGLEYMDGKLWVAALRLRGILRVDAKSWQPELLIPYNTPRAHGVTYDKGSIWLVIGDEQGAGLNRYDAATGQLLETVRFDESDADPHGLAIHDGALYSCDAGIHPGWAENKSPAHGYIFRIDLV
jgi:sugar lactone lactonase YvrE